MAFWIPCFQPATTSFTSVRPLFFSVINFFPYCKAFFCLPNCFLSLLLFCGAIRDFISQLVLLFNHSCKSVSVQIHAEKTICHKSVKAKWSKQSLRAHCFLSQPTSRPKNVLSSFRFWYCPLPSPLCVAGTQMYGSLPWHICEISRVAPIYILAAAVTGWSQRKSSKWAVPLKSRHKNTTVGTEFVTREIVRNKTLVAVFC